MSLIVYGVDSGRGQQVLAIQLMPHTHTRTHAHTLRAEQLEKQSDFSCNLKWVLPSSRLDSLCLPFSRCAYNSLWCCNNWHEIDSLMDLQTHTHMLAHTLTRTHTCSAVRCLMRWHEKSIRAARRSHKKAETTERNTKLSALLCKLPDQKIPYKMFFKIHHNIAYKIPCKITYWASNSLNNAWNNCIFFWNLNNHN